MLGIDERCCDASIDALVKGDISLTQLRVADALKLVRYGKKDTYSLDAVPELEIKRALEKYDEEMVLITEELGSNCMDAWPFSLEPSFHPLFFLCDPIDRSAYLVKYFESLSPEDKKKKVGEVVAEKSHLERWEEQAESPASITGATSAITCIRKGQVTFSVIINCITQVITVACSSGIKMMDLGDYEKLKQKRITLADILSKGKEVAFLPFNAKAPWDYFKHFTTFLGKSGYEENFRDSQLFTTEEKEGFLQYDEPGGPARVFYLSSLQPSDNPVGFILANGEKITEWAHWLPFIRFARHKDEKSLRLFEVFHDRPWTKEGILMANSSIYSIFQIFGGKVVLDVSFLKRFPNPSRFRSTLVVASASNEWINDLMQQSCYREINLD